MSKVNNKTVNEKTKELLEMVAWFDSDDFSVEEALERYKVAEKLAQEIQDDLESLKNEVKIVKQKFDADN